MAEDPTGSAIPELPDFRKLSYGSRVVSESFVGGGGAESLDVEVLVKLRFIVVAAAIVALAATATALGSGKAQQADKLKIALANSFIGNKWRIEMENVFKAACKMPPYNAQVDCSVYNSGNDVSKQTQQISNLVSQGVDAILVDAASGTGLNGIIAQACAHKILIVAYDNLVTAPCAIKINGSQYQYGQQNAQYIVDKLKGKGNVIMVTGVAGTQADTDRNSGAMDVFKKHSGIHVVAKYTGMWDSATAQRNTAAQLPSLPKIDGVWSSGGTDGIIKAMIAAGRPLPTVVGGEAENGFRRFMVGYNGKKLKYGLSLGQPPFNVLVALETARQVLKKEHAAPKGTIWLPFPQVNEKTVKVGQTVFTNVPDSFFDAFTDSGPKAIVKVCSQAALSGKACPGSLKVNVPWDYHPAGAR
jgi:ribose transport system substrate-binding protein